MVRAGLEKRMLEPCPHTRIDTDVLRDPTMHVISGKEVRLHPGSTLALLDTNAGIYCNNVRAAYGPRNASNR